MKRTSNSIFAIVSMAIVAVACGARPDESADDNVASSEAVYQSTEALAPAAKLNLCARECVLPKKARELSEYLRERAGCVEVCDGIDNNCNGTIDEGVTNACGGCAALPAELGSPCRSGDQCGTYECDGKEALKCGSLRPANECGGCAMLPGRVGDECRVGEQCGTYACNGVDALVCGSLHACALPERPEWDTAACLSWLDALVQQSNTMYFGSYAENANSSDPTGGYLLGSIPEGGGEWHSQLFASYVACDGSNVNVQGFVNGTRVGDLLQDGEWFLDLLEGDFWGSFNGIVNGNSAQGSYDTTNAAPGGQLIPQWCNAAGDGSGWGVPNGNNTDACYCSSPGTWQATKASSLAATFDVAGCQGSNGINISSTANPKPFLYTIFSASQACRKTNPLVAICPEEFQGRGSENACWANVRNECKIDKISDISPEMLRNCECFFRGNVDPYVSGDVYLVVGASSSQTFPSTPEALVEWVKTYLNNPGSAQGVTAYPRLYKHP